jgi:hypothetical protein
MRSGCLLAGAVKRAKPKRNDDENQSEHDRDTSADDQSQDCGEDALPLNADCHRHSKNYRAKSSEPHQHVFAGC